MNAPLLAVHLLACGPAAVDDTGGPAPLVLEDPSPDHLPVGDAVYLRYDGVPNLVRATPAGVEVLDLGGRTAVHAEATADGRFLLVLAEGEAGLEHLLVEDGAIRMAWADQETNRSAVSPDGRHLVLWHDDAIDPRTDQLVDPTEITLVDTVAGAVSRVVTGVVPKTVAVGRSAVLVVGPTGAMGLDLATQTPTQGYDFAEEGVADGAWGYWGALSPDEAWAFVSGDVDEPDATVARLGLASRSVTTVQAPGAGGAPRASHLFRVGDVLFVNDPDHALSTLDPDTLAFTAVEADVDYLQMEVQADRAVLYGDAAGTGDGTWLLWTEPEVAVHLDPAESGTHTIWFGADHAVIQHYTGGTWHAKALELATGDTWLAPVQDILVAAAVIDDGAGPHALLQIHGVASFGLLPLAEGSAITAAGTLRDGGFGAMANDEAFYVAGVDDDGYIGFIDPLTGEETGYDDFGALGLAP